MSIEKRSIDMTEGTIWKKILLFAIPLMLGELFQTLYNTVDSLIVGRIVGKAALAAVGSTNNIIALIVGFFVGFSTGTTVVIARFFGAKDQNGISRAVHTALYFILWAGIGFTIIGVLGTPFLLRLLGTPDDVFESARIYLQIYFLGMIGLVFYNITSAILRAVGDSRTPLYTLAISSLTNIILDFVLIYFVELGVAGAAIATIASEFLSALILIVKLLRTESCYRLVPSKLHIDSILLREILGIGLPQAIQKVIINLSNVLVLSYINKFGSDATAGWSIHQRLDQIINRTVQSLESATTTFVGQNIGAKKYERIRKGIRSALLLILIISSVYALIFTTGKGVIIRMFSQDQGVYEYGSIIIIMLVPTYLIHAYNHIQAGALRGYGHSHAATIIMVISTVVIRQIYLKIGWAFSPTIEFVLSCFPISWLAGMAGFAGYSTYMTRRQKQVK